MRDIWKTSNELERQGSSKLIWFASGHCKKKKAISFPTVAQHTREEERGEPCIQGPLLSTNKKYAAGTMKSSL